MCHKFMTHPLNKMNAFTLLSSVCNAMVTSFKYLCSGKKYYSIFLERNE